MQKKGLHRTEVLRKERKGVKGTKEQYSSDSDDHSSEQTETESKEDDTSESEEDNSVAESPKSKGKTIQKPEIRHSEITKQKICEGSNLKPESDSKFAEKVGQKRKRFQQKICKGSKPESDSKFAKVGKKRKRFQTRVKLPQTKIERPTQSEARGIMAMGSHQSSTVEHGSDISSMEQDTPVMTYKRAREPSDATAPTSFPNLPVSRKKSWKRKRRRRERLESTSSSSDTDDSSPESDMMRKISESETKKLRKVFRCFFGKLCHEIKDPVKMAAELQAKRLLSQSTMEEILTTPDSRQEKVIILVRSLQRRIKSRPDRIFGIVKFFMRIEAIGKEMWLETGKVCPERAAFVFGTALPPTEREPTVESLEGIKGEAVQGTLGKTHLPQPSVAIGVGDNVALPTVSQSLPQSGISQALTKYKQYLQSCYNARVLAPADKYLPTLDAPYINLAMIRREHCNPKQRDEFTRQTLHGGVDEILQSKTPINIEDLLTPDDSGNPVRFILVEGPPGIGKSTFAWEACRRWDEIESLRNYHVVVLLKLREKWVLNAASLSDLIRYPSHPDFSNSIAEELVKLQGEKLLFVLDGFDEVSHSFHENSVIKSILCRQLLPECTIILTTRPSAKSILESICQPRVDKHVEIIGFTEEERVRYITEVFSNEPELQVNFLKYMFHVPHVKSMMYIPLNCAIIAQVYYESQSSRHLAIPKTRTQLYKALTHSLLVRHMKMKESNFECTSMLPEGLNIEDKDMFMTLAKFCF
ncbi:NACHT, LRR and PYD domains-containing protein 3 [Geodia barretti]|uniref:NACHT, LRR and PYD domains-containing protein 3 n=1 Tax=Geodia barretti TaxID=519541 RepID=A0AA35T247_GEOBA|nr:NACHT, LRR and PYD domains-containing protein 3 [Geodia barretti]